MTINIEIAEDGALLLPLQGAALGPETQDALREHFRRELRHEWEREGERIKAWMRVAEHPFFEDCHEARGSLIAAMLAKLDRAQTPEPKPWHEAKRGDVWLVTRPAFYGATPTETVRSVNGSLRMVDVNSSQPAIDITDAAIVGAERIYPTKETS